MPVVCTTATGLYGTNLAKGKAKRESFFERNSFLDPELDLQSTNGGPRLLMGTLEEKIGCQQ